MWGTAEGDYLSTPSALNTVDQPGFYGWTGTGVMADVQAWLDAPVSNFGWILVGDESATASAKRFDSRENLSPSLRPTLYLLYTVPASAAGRVPDGRFLQGTELTILKTPPPTWSSPGARHAGRATRTTRSMRNASSLLQP